MTDAQRPEVTGQLMCRRYRLRELVGRGAAAAVYRAVDEALGREVALKVFSKEGSEPELPARQKAEIRILASLIHPALVTLFDAGRDPATERSFVVMEYVAGPDLRRHLRTGSLAPADIAVLGSDLASALDYIHSRGVIHRDLKPGNVLLHNFHPGAPGSQWRAKLTDFGIARVMDEDHLTMTGRTVGTAAYLSPEQALGEPLNGASDVYSLGLLLLECFTRQIEFPGTQIESGVARIHRNPVIPDTVGPEWKALLTAMTARHPADRPTAAAAAATLQQLALASDHETAAAAEPAPRPEVDSPRQPPRPSHQPSIGRAMVAVRAHRKRGKAARTAIAAALGAVILLGTTSGTFGGSSTDQAAAPARPAVPVQNNPLDFHLDQLETALQPSAALQPILGQVRRAITDGDLQAALTHLDRLLNDATQEASADGLTFEQYRDIVAAVRLLRTDLQALIASSTQPPVEAAPAAPQPAPDGVPAVDTEPVPVIAIKPAPAVGAATQDPAEQQDEVVVDAQTRPGPGAADKAKPDKKKSDKANDAGGAKNNR